MVGVPGRSKGCNTCIQRKVKCDGGRPLCGTCSKSNRLCTGYKRPLTFVLAASAAFEPDEADGSEPSTIVTKGRWRKQPRKKPLPAVAAASQSSTASADDIRYFKTSFAPPRAGAAATATTTATTVWTGTPPPLPGTIWSDAAWREQLFPVYMAFHLPAESLQSSCRQSRAAMSQRNWLLQVQDDPGLVASPALDAAMTALVLARVGRRAGNAALVRHSFETYTRGLQQLRAAVRSDATRLADHTLAACVALSMYEVAECPSGNIAAYSAHHTGGLVLLHMRGASAPMTPLARALLVFIRTQNFIFALDARTNNFLGHDEWLHAPYAATSDPRDKFLNQMYGITALFEQEDALARAQADAPTRVRGYVAIIASYRAIYAYLRRWYRDLQAAVPGPLYWPELSALPCPVFDHTAAGRPFPVAFHFPAFSVGQSLVLFWLVAMVANFNMAKLYQAIAGLAQPADAAGGGGVGGVGEANVPFSPSSSSSSLPHSPPAGAGAGAATAVTPGTTTSQLPGLPPPTRKPEASMSRATALAAAAEAAAIGLTMAHNICQSVEFFLAESMGEVGTLAVLLPLVTVRGALGTDGGPSSLSGSSPVSNADAMAWIDFLLIEIGGQGQRMAFHLDN